jgi:hypothetical protein
MENKYIILNPATVPPDKEREPIILYLNTRSYAGLPESQPGEMASHSADDEAFVQHQTVQSEGIRHEQQVRLVGKPYSMYDDVDYFLAISG